MLAAPQLLLASCSPRRKQLLAQLGLQFSSVQINVDETLRDESSTQAYVQRLAIAKAQAGVQLHGTQLPVLGADTAVVLDGKIMGKPKDQDDAFQMLQQLSGRVHEVQTAVAIVQHNIAVETSTSRVTFRDISAQEARAYWESGEPSDKAGGYAIQGYGAIFVTHLEGSYSGVMGLPIYETAQLLKKFNISILDAEIE